MSQRSGRSRRAQRARQQRRRQQLRIGAAVGLVALAIVVGVVVLASGGGGGDTALTDVDLFEFGIGGDLDVAAGPVRLAATNTGEIPHNVGIRGGPISNSIDPGESLELDLGELAPGTYELYCDLAGHEEAGMVADFVVTG